MGWNDLHLFVTVRVLRVLRIILRIVLRGLLHLLYAMCHVPKLSGISVCLVQLSYVVMFPSHLSVLSSSWIRLLLLQGACPFILSWPPLSLSVGAIHLAKGAAQLIPTVVPPLVVFLDMRAPKAGPATCSNTIDYIFQVINSKHSY